jgi:hypothetical protein
VTGDTIEYAKGKDAYQSQQVTDQANYDKARILTQLDAKPEGREWGEIQAWDGLGPEVINSRLAMLGFAIALVLELTTGLDVYNQAREFPLMTIAVFVIFTAASWIPFEKGTSYNVKSGIFTPSREILLGRIAMVGFTGLILTELALKHAVFPRLFGY